MAQDPKTLIWLDMEMTGLEPDRDRIIEIALVLTNEALETIAEAPVITVHQPDSVLDLTGTPSTGSGVWLAHIPGK